MMKWIKILPVAVLLLMGVTVVSHAEDKPKVIRYGFNGNGLGRPFTGGVGGVINDKNLLEKEFAKDGIRIEKTFLASTGPGLNEAFASGLLDIAGFGDFPNIVGRAGGLKTRWILVGVRGDNSRIIVHPESNITSVKQLKGLRIGVAKGTWAQLWFAKILVVNGLTEKDVKVLNLKGSDATAAFVAGSIDAVVGGSLSLVDQGLAKILYESNKDPQSLRGRDGLLVTEAFAQKYPDIVKRIVKVNIQAAYWLSQPQNTAEYLRISGKTGGVYKDAKKDYLTHDLKVKWNPRLDKEAIDHYQAKADFCYANGYIRNKLDVEKWADKSFSEAALKELGLENYWK